MRGKLLNIKKLLLAIFIVGSIFYAPQASGQAATMTANIETVCAGSASPIIKFTYTGTGNEGPAPYTFTYKINNGTSQTVTTVTGYLAVDAKNRPIDLDSVLATLKAAKDLSNIAASFRKEFDYDVTIDRDVMTYTFEYRFYTIN